MAGAAPGLDDNQTAMWRALVAGPYFAIPARQCRDCQSHQACGKFFCTSCRVGNLCGATFRGDGAHAPHPQAGIRVWKVTHRFSLWIDDVRRFMPNHIADRLQLYRQNGRLNVKLVKPEREARNINPSGRPLCTGSCGDVISTSTVPNLSALPVCSVQCLLDDLDAGAGVAVPRAVRVRPDADAVPRPRPVAGPLDVIGAGEAEPERGRVPNVDVQEGHGRRRNRRKPNKASVWRVVRLGNHETTLNQGVW